MEEIRSFHKGVDADTALDMLPEGSVRDLLNFRVIDTEGQGYILSSIRGSEEAFALPDGFLPRGHAVYNGIAYIFSYNPVTGEGEVGTFPSPLYNGNTGFTHSYKALRNWSGITDPRDPSAVFGDFRTTLFNFACSNQLEVEARLSYDNSVDLFFTDHRNPLRKINAGFDHRTGSPNGRNYWTGSFPSQIDVFFESSRHPVTDDVVLGSNGLLQAGNWFVYGRYLTADLNPTSFLLEVGPIQLSQDELSEGVRTDGQEGLANTGRSITLQLSNIDSTFPYIQFAVVYYHNDTVEAQLVTNLYSIEQGSTTTTVTIFGTEELAAITIGELTVEKSTIDCVKSITQHKQRLWGGNWKESEVDYELLEQTAQGFIARPPAPAQLLEMDDDAWHKSVAANTPFQYKDYRNTLNSVGYFRGEPYAFAVQFVFRSGKVSIPYPVRGYDAWGDPAATLPNTRGILRFPAITQDTDNYALTTGDTEAGGGSTSKVRVMGVVLDNSTLPWSSLDPWIQNNVVGFYILRAERKPQLIYQGLVSNAYKPTDANGDWSSNTLQDIGSLYGINGWDNFTVTPHHISTYRRGTTAEESMKYPYWHNAGGTTSAALMTNFYRIKGKFGFFSNEHFFRRTMQNGTYRAHVVGAVTIGEFGGGGSREPYKNYFERINTPASESFLYSKLTAMFPFEAVNVAPWEGTPIAGFVSRFTEGNAGEYPSTPPSAFLFQKFGPNHEVGNREMTQRTYVGMTVDIPEENKVTINGSSAQAKLVNVYRSLPLDTIDALYDPGLEPYYRISEFVPVTTDGGPAGDNWDAMPTRLFYRGDCFLQRCYTKILADGTYHDADDLSDTGTNYSYGTVIGLIQECAINTAMRYEQGQSATDRRYTPELSWFDFALGLYANGNSNQEAWVRNAGYDRTLGLKSRLGNDVFVPYRGLRYPVRVKYSAEYLPGSFIDGYLQWDLGAQRDYLHSYGEITRVHSLDRLLVVQENATIAPYTNERAVIPATTSSQAAVVGNGDVLSHNFDMIGEYGSQHQWSVIKTKAGIIGYDQQQRTFWTIANGMNNLSETRMFSKIAFDLSEFVSQHSDIMHRYPDAPVCDAGVVAWEDPRNKEFGWTFGVDAGSTSRNLVFETIAFNYKRDVYAGRRSHNSPYYITLNRDLFSVNPATLPWGTNNPPISTFWRHDMLATHSTFYGTLFRAQASPVFNAGAKQPKLFDAIVLASVDVPLTEIQFSTEFQSSTFAFATTDIALAPKYKETRWHFPVPKASAVVTGGVQEFGIKSPLRGRWLRMDLKWETNSPLHVEFVSAMHRFSVQ